jgi:hypothetical protein
MDTGAFRFVRISDAYAKLSDARRLTVVLSGSFDLSKGGVTVEEEGGCVVGMNFSEFPLCRVGRLDKDMMHHGFARQRGG